MEKRGFDVILFNFFCTSSNEQYLEVDSQYSLPVDFYYLLFQLPSTNSIALINGQSGENHVKICEQTFKDIGRMDLCFVL